MEYALYIAYVSLYAIIQTYTNYSKSHYIPIHWSYPHDAITLDFSRVFSQLILWMSGGRV
jgi:hypothetical protein